MDLAPGPSRRSAGDVPDAAVRAARRWLLAFALSFDEIIVTTFTAGAREETLPIWIFSNLFRTQQAPVVNVVAAALILLSIIPIWVAQRLAGTDESVASAH